MRIIDLDFIPPCPAHATGDRAHMWSRRGVLLDVFGAGTAVSGVAQAAGSIGAAEISANAANHAADLSSQATANSLAFTKQQYDTSQKNAAPYLSAGATALGQLSAGTADGGSLVTPYQDFTAPTGVNESNDPGYAFRLQQGQQALERGAAAAGGAFSGGTEKALARYGQDYASNEYANVFNRAQSTYNTNQGNYYTGQGNNFNRLSSIAGMGQTANGQATNAGTGAAANVASASLAGANAQGNYLTQGASATGAGVLGATGAVNNANNSYQNGQLLAALQNGPGVGNGGGSYNVPYQPGYYSNSYSDDGSD